MKKKEEGKTIKNTPKCKLTTIYVTRTGISQLIEDQQGNLENQKNSRT